MVFEFPRAVSNGFTVGVRGFLWFFNRLLVKSECTVSSGFNRNVVTTCFLTGVRGFYSWCLHHNTRFKKLAMYEAPNRTPTARQAHRVLNKLPKILKAPVTPPDTHTPT